MKKLLHAMRNMGTLVVLVLLLSITQTQAQLVVSAPPAGPNYTALVQNFFVGQGVTVSNVTYTGAAQAIGSFSNSGTNLSLSGGILLTTGNRALAVGPNNATNAGAQLGRPGIPELNAQAGATTYDGATLQFDFVAQSTSVSFQYIWASEEYPEYVNTGYNDAFSFFISGPGFGGPTNIALVPSTTTPITIDNVNSGSYSQYYVNNAGGQYIQYDGFTTTMTATATVQPCQTYTLRICIADAGDQRYDSGVFLGQNSLSSNSVTVSSSSGYNGSSNAAYEGCLPGYLNFSIPQAQLTDYTFNYVIGGSAQNGVDYTAIPTSVTIPAGQTSAQVVINAINDNIAEGQETVDITVNNMCSVSTTSVYINDVAPLTVNAGVDQLQCGTPTAATLTAIASGGLTPYTYSWSNGVSNVGNTASITNTPTATTTYTVTATGACPGQTATDQVVVTVNPIPTSTFNLSSATVCNGQPLTATYSGNANVGATYNWSVNNSATITGSGQGPVTINYPSPGTYTVSLSVVQNGCTSTTTSTANATVYPQPNSPFTSPTTLCTGANGTFNFTGTTIPGATYTWNFNGGTVVSGTGSGPYSINWATAGTKTVTLTVAANGCTSTSTASVNVIQTPASTFTATSPVCTGQNSAVTYTGTVIPGATYTWGFNGGTVASGSGVGPYQVNWATAGTKNITLTVTSNGCTSTTTTVPVVVNAIPTAAFTSSANPVCNGQPLTVSATAVSGATYNWSVNNNATITGNGVGPVTVNYPGVGTYVVSLAVTANGCTSSAATSTITVNPQPTANFTAATPLCTGVNGTVTYNGTPIPGATYTWNFNGGTVASGSGMGPYQLNWATAGTKTVTLTVAANGCTATSSQSVVVNQMPTSNFSVSAAQFCAGANATVTYGGTVIPGATYSWNFNGGTVVSGSGVGPYQIAWGTAGVKTITLSVTSNGCTSTISSQSVTIYQVPTSTFTASAATVCAGQPLTATYSGNASGSATYTWSANNGATITGSGQGPVSLNYPSAGSYNITLNVAENGCSSTATTVPVTVNPQPTATFTATSPICTGNNGTITYTGTQIPGATYTWNFAGGTVASGTGAGPYSVSWATAGTKNVTLTVAAAGCTASNNVNVVVNPMPSSAFSVSAAQFCAGANATVTYNAVPVTGSTYTWNFNGGTVVSGSGMGPYTVNWSTAGTKTITLTVSANGCTSTVSTQTITIYQVPTSTFTLSSNNVCDGSPVNITYGGNASPNATYNWTVNNNGSIGSNPLRLIYPAPGTYNIGLTVTENGCSSTTTTIAATVKPMPTSPFTVSNTQFCAGANATVTYTGTPITGATYAWNFNGGIVVSGSGAGPYQIAWSTPGTKTLTLSVTAAGCTSTVSTQTITIYQVPTSTFTLSSNSVCDGSPVNITYGGNASPNATYNWTVNNGGSIGNNPLRLIYPAPGTYNIGLTVTENGCSSTATTIAATIHPIPVSNFSVSNTQFCAGANATISYNGTPITGANYSWNFNGGTVVSGSGMGPYSVNWSTAGVKNITLTVSANGCTSSVTSVPVTIYQVPTSTFTASATSVCDGSPINITYSGNASPNATYNWAVNNGGSIGNNPLHLVYPAPGNYNIALTVSENGCSSTTNTIPVTVKPMPTSAFTVSNTQFCAGANATVTYTGTPITGASYTWNFNGGTVVSGSGMGPYSIAWNTPGAKTVTLTVSANGCTSTLTSVPVTVYQVPTSTFALSSNSVCDGQPVNITYSGNASPGATYNWTVNNNGSIGNNPLRLIYPAPGSYNIGLTVTENGCSSTSTTLSATVKPQPVATFTAPTPICTGQPEIITYTGTQITGASYTWGFNGAIVASGSNAGPYNISWLTPGTKNVTLTVNAAGCTASSSNAVVVNQMPTSAFSVSNTQFCAGGNATVTFNGVQVQGATYTWNFAGGNIVSGSGMGPYTINWDTAGTKQITLTVSANGCTSTTTTIPVTIYQVPTSSFTTSASSICNGQQLGITYNGNASPNANYSWVVNNGGSVANNPLRLVYPTSGSYNITLNVTENGCSSSASTVPVTVYTVPTANFTVQGPICEGASVNVLYTGNANLNNAQFTWGWDGGTATNTTGENYSVQYASAGNYDLTLHIEENGCASVDVTRPLVVNAIPASTFIATSPVCIGEASVVTYTGSAPQSATYAWTFDGGSVASGSGQGPYNINWNNAGVKSLQLIVTHNGCASPQTIVPVTVNDRPTAAFTIADTSICMGQPVTITYNGTGSPNATYNWTASGGATVSHISGNTYQMGYPGAGNYTVALSVTENGCASATPVTAQVAVYNMPTSAFVSSGSPICTGTPLSVIYQGNASPNANFVWNVTNGATVGSLTPTGYPVNYPGAGTYNISLTVSENGCTSTQSSTSVVVYQTPTSAFITSANPVCNGNPVDFYYNGNASPNAVYTWDVTSGASIIPSGTDTFNLAYTGAGTYVVKLSVSEDGCSSTMSSDTVTVFEVPVSVFAAVQNPVCDGQPVILNYNGAQIQNAVYTWTTPDSVYIEESGLTSYEVFYPGAGTYNVSLKVTANGCSSDDSSLPIVVNSNPVAPFTASNNVCAGANGNIIYTGVQDPAYTYNWNFNGGNIVSGSGVGPYQVAWGTDGVKDVTLIVTNGNGCSSDTATAQVIVYPIPSSNFSVTGPLCTGSNGTVYYMGAPLQNSTYNWNFDGANVLSGVENGPYSLSWNTPGTKLITLDVTANGCTSPVTSQTVQVNPTPTASFTALDSAVCEGPITLVYNGNASPGASYNWFSTGGATVSGTGSGPFTVNYPGAGTYYITLTVDENGCTSPISATVPVTVLPSPNVYFTVPVGECFGTNSYNFLAQGQFTFQADIAWDFGPNANVQTSSVINPNNISFNTTGPQTVSLTVTDNGCTSNFSNAVQVYPDPVVNFSVDQIRGCSPLEVQFTDNSGYADLATYSWNFGDGDTSSLQNPIHIYEQAGTYSPTLTITFSSACGGSITQSGLITVYPQPVAGFTATPQHTDMFDPFVTVVNDGIGATACYYTMGDGDTLMNTLGGTHEYKNAGVYTITQFVSNNFGCVDTAQRVVRIDGQFTIYIPNAFSPNRDGINDSFGAKGTMVNNFTMYIFDRWGELIFTGHGIDDYWDGSDPSGKRSQVDVYVYKVVYDEPNGDQKQVTGTVALID